MNTFLPYPDYKESLQSIDIIRLNKQKLETMQLLNAFVRQIIVESNRISLDNYKHLIDRHTPQHLKALYIARHKSTQAKRSHLKFKGWLNHPSKVIWKGYEKSLCHYGLLCCRELVKRGYQENCSSTIAQIGSWFSGVSQPHWLGQEDIHLQMRQSLRYKEVVDNANLIFLGKKPQFWYRNQWPDVEPLYGYHWSHDEDRRTLPMPEEKAMQRIDWLSPDQIKKAVAKKIGMKS